MSRFAVALVFGSLISCSARAEEGMLRVSYSQVSINPATKQGVEALRSRTDGSPAMLVSAERPRSESVSTELSAAKFRFIGDGSSHSVVLSYGPSFPFSSDLVPGSHWLFYFEKDGAFISLLPDKAGASPSPSP